MTIKDHIKGQVTFFACQTIENIPYFKEYEGMEFRYYRKGYLVYQKPNGEMIEFEIPHEAVLWYVTDTGLEFPVPVSDTGDADFLPQDKAMFFMRWIRKAIP